MGVRGHIIVQKFRTCIRRIILNAVTLVTYRNCELLQKYET